MTLNAKNSLEDSWLSKALIYYKILDQSLFKELVMRNTEEKYFYDILLKNNYLNEREVRQFVNIALQIPSLDVDHVKPEKDVLQKIPEDVCRRYDLLGLKINKSHIAVAFSDPFNLDAEHEIERLSRKYVKKFFVPIDLIRQKIDEYYSSDKVISSFGYLSF